MDRFGDFKMATRLKASIIGITGYTGLELLRMLMLHPQVEIAYLTSRQHKNTKIGDVYPHLSHLELFITDTSPEIVAAESDVVFLALPHKTAQDTVALIDGKTKVIDLSADFRLDDTKTYEKYYNTEHKYPELLKTVAYGLPEINRADIANSKTVANPGCFALLSQILIYPFKDKIEHVDIFAITGSSGSGKTASEGTHHPVRNHNIKSYNINTHRHIPEIIRSANIDEKQLNFVPTSGPFARGIFAQAFITLKQGVDTDRAVKNANLIYENEHFIRYQKQVSLANITGSNYVDVSYLAEANNRILAQGAIDNLVKGAAGNAVQNMNLMFGIAENTGLDIVLPLYP